MLSPVRSPVFSYQNDHELKDLMAEYLLPSQQDPTAFQEEQAKNQQILWAQFQFQRIMRDYLKEFWRHEVIILIIRLKIRINQRFLLKLIILDGP
jgi:hypothetical protein